MWPCQVPAAMVSTTVTPATKAVRRSSAAITAVNGGMTNSGITIPPDTTSCTPDTKSHKTATAIATYPVGRSARAVTPAHPPTPA